MTWESDEQKEPEDRSKFLWYAVAGMLVIMVGVMWVVARPTTHQSRARVRHILIQFQAGYPAERERALEIVSMLRERIVNGGDFSKIAKEFSNDAASARRGGDLGWVQPGDLFDPVDEFIWTGPMNEMSHIIQTPVGFHLVLVSKRNLSKANLYENELQRRSLNATQPKVPTETEAESGP